MSYYLSQRDHRNHSVSHGSAQDIKKGLEKIKQDQIQVMKQLRRDDPEISRNFSLTYSKQTHLDNKNLYYKHHSPEKARMEKLQNYQKAQFQFKQQRAQLEDQLKKQKQSNKKMQQKLKQYQKGQQKALVKAQEALSNAILSQKKYLQAKSQLQKALKERQKLTQQLHRVQYNLVEDILKQNQDQRQISSKIIKQLKGCFQCFHQMSSYINMHKCYKKQISSNTHYSSNSLTISTFQLTSKFEKHMNNVILQLNNMNSFMPIQQISSKINSNLQNQNYLSISFREDIKKIQQEMDQVFTKSIEKQKKMELEAQNDQLKYKIKAYQDQNTRYKQQNKLLKQQNKDLKYQYQISKLNEFVQRETAGKSKSKQKRTLFEKYKKLGKISESAPIQQFMKRLSSKSSSSLLYEKDPEKYSQFTIQLFQDRIDEVQKQNSKLQQKLQANLVAYQNLKVQTSKKQNQADILKSQVQKIKSQLKIAQQQLSNSKCRQQKMTETIQKLEQQINKFKLIQTNLNNTSQVQSIKYQNQVEQLEVELQYLKKQLEDMRRDSIVSVVKDTSFSLNKSRIAFDNLWFKKTEQFKCLQTILTQFTTFNQKIAQAESTQKSFDTKKQFTQLVYKQQTPKLIRRERQPIEQLDFKFNNHKQSYHLAQIVHNRFQVPQQANYNINYAQNQGNVTMAPVIHQRLVNGQSQQFIVHPQPQLWRPQQYQNYYNYQPTYFFK